MVEGGAQPLCQRNDGAGALDVGFALLGLADRDVIDRRAVHQVVDLAELGDHLLSQIQLGQFPDQRLYPVTPIEGEALEAAQRLAPDQYPHLGIGLMVQQSGNESAANKPGTAGNDIPHGAHRGGMRPPRQPLSRRGVAADSPDLKIRSGNASNDLLEYSLGDGSELSAIS